MNHPIDGYDSHALDFAGLLARRLALRLATAVRWLAFWGAILLPLVIVPAVLTGRLDRHPHAFFGLVVLNVVCVVAGHNHRLQDR